MTVQRTFPAARTRRTVLGAVAVAASALLALSACSGGSVTGNSGGGSGKTTVTVWHLNTGGAATEIKKLTDAYNASQSKYDIQLQFAASSDQFDAKLLNAVKNNTGPQLVIGDSTPTGLGQIIQTGKVLPLDAKLKSGGKVALDDFTEGMRSTGTFDGTLYSIPTDVGDFAVVYNKQMFSEAGISSPPTTWDEFAADAKKLTKGTSQYGAYLPIGDGEWPVFTWQAMLWGAGGDFLNADNSSAAFNSPAGVKALTAWTSMVKDGSAYPQSLATPSDGNGTGALTSKKVAMEINGAYNLNTIDTALGKDNVGVFALPSISTPGMNLGTDNSYLLKGTARQEAGAWDFLQYWLSPSTQAKWDIATGFFPSNTKTSDDPTWKAFLAKNPRIKIFVDELAYAKARPSITQYAAVSAALSTEIQKAMLQQESPADALAAAESGANAALK